MSDEKPEAAKADAEAEKAEAAAASEAPAAAAEEALPSDAAPEASDVPAEAATDSTGEPSGKRKKRKRKKLDEPELRPLLGPDGRERPAFLLGFPNDPELERLMRAFELGNYALVRSDAPELALRTSDAKVRAAAEELRRRIDPDPLLKVLLGFSIALLFVLTFWAYKTHGN